MLTPDPRTLGLLAAILTIAVVGAARLALAGGLQNAAADPGLRRIAQGATTLSGLVWFLIVFGASVRVNGAGLACPDWPACFGQVIPALDWEVSLEFGHRVVAGVASLGFLGVAFASLRRPSLRPGLGPLVGLAGVALATQIVLGGLTVLHLLAEWTVASHLVTGNLFSLLVGLIALRLRDEAAPVARSPIPIVDRVVAAGMLPLVFAQLALGGLVAASHAGLACGTWPSCNGGAWFPTLAGVVGLQVTHRITAYALLAAGLGLLAITRGQGRVGKPALAVCGLLAAQATIGVANVLLRLPVEVTLLHSAGAAALVLAVGWLNHEAWRSPLRAAHPEPAGRLVEAR